MLGPTGTYFPRIYTGSARSPVRTERSFFTGAHATVRYKTKSLPSRSAKEQPFITSTAQMASRTSMCGRSTRSARRSSDIHLVDRSLRAISEIRDSVNPLTSHSTLVARLTALGVRFRLGGDGDPISTLRRYLSEQRTTTARELARKAVVLIEPDALLGKVVWPA